MNKYLLLALLAATHPARADDGSFSLGAGFDFSSGKYGGDTSTNILYVPVVARYETDSLTLKLTVPYIRVTSLGNVVRGMGVISRTAATRTTTQSGLGDVVATAAYGVYDASSLMLDVAANVKFGTASASKGLGTGENDYSAQLDAYYTVSATTLFATAGHKIVGAPEGIAVNNINYGTLGVSQKLNEKHTAGIMLDVAQSPTELAPGTRELTAFFTNKLGSDRKLQTSVMKGYSDASPDWGVNLMLTNYF
ncbi:MAG TPA: hypothetical protein VFR06_02665 [Gallionellaceae bacterium]|nr:hypothetical protein [Gallionellaceae bacterium]